MWQRRGRLHRCRDGRQADRFDSDGGTGKNGAAFLVRPFPSVGNLAGAAGAERASFFIIEENMVLEEGKYYPMMLAVRAGADWDVELENAQRKKHRLAEKLLQSGLTEKMCRFAGDWLGWQLMDSRSEVLFSFLEHTIKTDEALLLAMPKPDGDRAADCSDQRIPGDDAAERILKRRTELEARIQLSEKVLEVLKMEKQ